MITTFAELTERIADIQCGDRNVIIKGRSRAGGTDCTVLITVDLRNDQDEVLQRLHIVTCIYHEQGGDETLQRSFTQAQYAIDFLSNNFHHLTTD